MFYNTALNKQTDKHNFKGWSRGLCYLGSWWLKCVTWGTEESWSGKEQIGWRTQRWHSRTSWGDNYRWKMWERDKWVTNLVTVCWLATVYLWCQWQWKAAPFGSPELMMHLFTSCISLALLFLLSSFPVPSMMYSWHSHLWSPSQRFSGSSRGVIYPLTSEFQSTWQSQPLF